MADIKMFTADEAMSAEQGGVWDVQTEVETSGTTTVDVDVSNYHTVIIDCTSTIDIRFDHLSTTSPAMDDGKDLKIPAGITSIKVPKGIGNTIYLHWRRNGANNATVRMVLC